MIDAKFKKNSYFNIFVLPSAFNYNPVVAHTQLLNSFNDPKVFTGHLLSDD